MVVTASVCDQIGAVERDSRDESEATRSSESYGEKGNVVGSH